MQHLHHCNSNLDEPKCLKQIQSEISKVEITSIILIVNYDYNVINTLPTRIIERIKQIKKSILSNANFTMHGMNFIGSKKAILNHIKNPIKSKEIKDYTNEFFGAVDGDKWKNYENIISKKHIHSLDDLSIKVRFS